MILLNKINAALEFTDLAVQRAKSVTEQVYLKDAMHDLRQARRSAVDGWNHVMRVHLHSAKINIQIAERWRERTASSPL